MLAWGRATARIYYPNKSIINLASKKRVELIVVGTVCRTGLPGFFIGNTAEKILHEKEK